MRAAKLGKTHTVEHNAKIAASLIGNQRRRGVPHTSEIRERFAREFKKRTDEERFWSKVVKTDRCWLIGGAGYRNGYGRLLVGSRADGSRREILAHRFSWEMLNGPIPDGLHVCHRCDADYPSGDTTYRRCVRPDHLFLGTHADNMRDMTVKKRQAKGAALTAARQHRARTR
jgi:hypothetical protein